MKISKSDLGWMAATIDMKGHIVRKNNKQRRTPQMVLVVDCRDERIVKRLSELTGTNPEFRPGSPPVKFMRRGCSEHCPEAHFHVDDYPWRMPEIARWTVTGIGMAIVLRNLKPYMCTYSEYAGDVKTVLDNTVIAGQGSGMVRSSIMRLMGLGWEIPDRIAHQLMLQGVKNDLPELPASPYAPARYTEPRASSA